MTRKNYIAMAAAISGSYKCYNGNDPACQAAHRTAEFIAVAFARIAAEDNPRFNRAKFMEACGLS